jgi:hypothetical protein
MVNHRRIELMMTVETENSPTSTETGVDRPAVKWAQRSIRISRSPMNPTIIQGNRYVAIRRKWADYRSSGSVRQGH